MHWAVTHVSPLSDYELLLTFAGGEQKIFDVKPYLTTGVFAALKDEALFGSVRVAFDTVQWANGADLCPEVLYSGSRPAKSESVERAEAP